jgi:sarcosine oxidase subunit gamma
MAETVLRPIPDRARFSLRCAEAPPPVLGLQPPARPLASATAGAAAALWLGPDEWLLLAEPGTAPPAVAGCQVIDIGHRHLAFALEGPGAALVLNEGCPLDLDAQAFPPGACTRSLFGRIEIILWRRGPEAFEIEVARSFAEPLRALLQAAIGDLEPPP